MLKGETLVDTAMNIEAMAPDMIVLRHASSGAGHLLSRICRSRIINAGDGMHEHPTQALLDAFTIREHKKRIDGLKVDHRRRPAAQPRAALERHAADQARRRRLGERAADARAARHRAVRRRASRPSIDEAVADADVIMMLRIQQERMQGALHPVAARVLQHLRDDDGARRRARSRT